eukprot:432173_1
MDVIWLAICLFFPCVVILLFWLYAVCNRQPHVEWTMLRHNARKQTCYFTLHLAISLWFLSLITLDMLVIYFNTSLPPITFLNLTDEYVTWTLFIISALSLQMSTTLRYDRYYSFNTVLNVTLGLFYVMLVTLYVFQQVESPNDNVFKYITIMLCSVIILLFAYISYTLYQKPIVKLRLLVDHYIDDFVTDKKKADQYADTLPKEQIQLLISGWIRENIFSLYVPTDIEQLCGVYLLHKIPRRKTSISSLLSGLFSLSISDVSVNQLFHGHEVNRYAKDKLETALKRVFIYKFIGIAMFICCGIYYVRFIIFWKHIIHLNDTLQDLLKLCMDIGLYVCVWIEAFCHILLMPSSKFIYDKCCCICKYRMNRKTMHEVDERYKCRNLFSLHDVKTNDSKWSFSTEPQSWMTRYYSYNNRQSMDSFEYTYTSRSRLLT